jgi:hypothetical protein
MNNFLSALKPNLKTELGRYDLVVHMQSPTAYNGYDFSNPIRTESASQAKMLDRKILQVWAKHPHRVVVAHKKSFIEKVEEVLSVIGAV